MTDLIREYLTALPDALLACQVEEYTVKLLGDCIEVHVTKRFGEKIIYHLDPENVVKYEKGLQDWWALMKAEA